ncbi:MAG: nitroreductase family protein [Clostridium sp.]|nr:nitroreductase family protein [Clostridium sp.]MCM1443737.1 nitroreductase family protein [Candidatus Amulumruptor caecigallinarius]
MNTISAIYNRRSIRNFKTDKIKKDIIEDILNCGRLAPSAKNKQPWYFVIVQDEIKDEIADMMIDYTINNDDDIERKKYGYANSAYSTANVIKQVPILVLVFRKKDDNWIVGDNLSIGACVENMCLRATDLGIGSLWIRDIVYVQENVAKMLGHEDLELNCAVSFGFPNQKPKQRSRKELKNIMEWY